VRIQLRDQGGDAPPDWHHEGTHDHPFDHRLRIVAGGEVYGSYQASRDPGRPNHFYVTDVKALTRGGGRLAMQHLSTMADRHGVSLTGLVKPLEGGAGVKMSKAKLHAWYRQFGFERDKSASGPDFVVRHPRQGEAMNKSAHSRFELLKARVASPDILDAKPSDQGGVTGGGFVNDTDGTPWYRKDHNDRDHAHIEHLANHVYRELGIAAPRSQILYSHRAHPSVPGRMIVRPVYLSKIIPRVRRPFFWDEFDDSVAHKHLRGLAADVLLGNRDLHNGNVLVVNEKHPVRIDNGSALHFNAFGTPREIQGYHGSPGSVHGFHEIVGSHTHEAAMRHLGLSYNDVTSPKFLRKGVHDIAKLHEKWGGWGAFVDHHIPGAGHEERAKATSLLNGRTLRLFHHVSGDKHFDFH
jgi:hypothetical protein